MRKYWPSVAFAAFVVLMIIATVIIGVQLNDFHP